MLHHIQALSRRLGLTLTVAAVLLWVYFGTRLAIVVGVWVGLALAPEEFVYLTSDALCLIVGLGGVVGVWLIAEHVEFRRRGFRARWVKGNCWLYEERAQSGKSRFLPCTRTIVGEGYRAPCIVHIPNEPEWNALTPAWARDRRQEISQRINVCFGGSVTAFAAAASD